MIVAATLRLTAQEDVKKQPVAHELIAAFAPAHFESSEGGMKRQERFSAERHGPCTLRVNDAARTEDRNHDFGASFTDYEVQLRKVDPGVKVNRADSTRNWGLPWHVTISAPEGSKAIVSVESVRRFPGGNFDKRSEVRQLEIGFPDQVSAERLRDVLTREITKCSKTSSAK